MSFLNSRPRLGGDVDAYCTRCKFDQSHTVEALDETGQPVRVRCNSCGSQHNYHSPRSEPRTSSAPNYGSTGTSATKPTSPATGANYVSAPSAADRSDPELARMKRALREVLHEEWSTGEVELGDRWRNGVIIIRPGREGLQDKEIPIDTFFHKIVMLRDRLRVMEQRINSNDKLSDEEKVGLQQYITACYGSLTTFNILFKFKDDQFSGAGN